LGSSRRDVLRCGHEAPLGQRRSSRRGTLPCRCRNGDLDVADDGNLRAAFAAGVAELESDDISEPIRSSFGWHIAQRSGTRMQDVSEDVRRQRAALALRERKVQEETQLWLQRLRAEAFVEYKK